MMAGHVGYSTACFVDAFRARTWPAVGIFAMLLVSVAGTAIAQDESLVVEEIIVQGEKIRRTADDAPTSISVISGEQAGAAANSDIDDVIDSEPNVLANEGFKPPAIRGVDGVTGGRSAITAGSQPRIPIVVDDVALPSGEASTITQGSTWDVDVVEVARGPQATSTGRNALGGAIRVFTRDPEFFHEYGTRLRFSDQAEVGADFMLNTPLIEDQLALRLTAELSIGNSYIDNNPSPLPDGRDPNDEELARVRGKLLFEPDFLPGLSVLASAEWSESRGPTEGFFDGDISDLSVTSGVFGLVSSYEAVSNDRFSLKTSYDFTDNLTLVTRASLQDNELRFTENGEQIFGLFLFGETRFEKILHEGEAYLQFEDLGIVSSGVFGVIHSVEDEQGSNNGQLLTFSLDGQITNTGIYGEVELDGSDLLPGLAFIAGGRYEIDDRSRDIFDGAGNLIGTSSFDETAFLPKAGLRYDFNDDSSVGYTYSQGFRAGGLDVDVGAPFGGFAITSVVFQPERLKQHEIYGRTTIADVLDLRASAFFYSWEDAQVAGAASYPGSGDAAIGNIPEAEGLGLELFAAYQITDEISVSGSLGLLDTEITEVNAEQAALLGEELPRAPNLTGSVGLTYQGENGLDGSVSLRHVGGHVSDLSQPDLDAYTIVDASLGFEEDFGGLQLRLDAFVNNVFDERFQTFNEVSGGFTLQKAGAPRTFGFAATFRF